MGAKVEGKIYIPGCFDMADSSVNSNCNALPYFKENRPSVHLSDKFTIKSSNGSVQYDKEMLKRTMLVHEATFRKQVYELHRLYKIQKELMAQFQREEFNGCPRYADALQPRSSPSQVLLGDVKQVCQTVTPISGHDHKQSSIDLINESSSQYSVSGAPLRHNNVRSQNKMLDLQLPADVYADDDDDVEILEVRPSKSLPLVNGSILGGNVNLNIENSEGSWITDMQAHHSSAAHILNKPVEESSSMKMTDFFGVGTSASQNQHYVSQGVNLNILSLEGKLKEKCVGKISFSRFFGANEDARHCNSFGQRKDDSNASMAWYKQNCTGSSMGHYPPSASTFNHLIFAPPSFNHALNPPWQSNNASYLTKSHYGAAETSIAKHAPSSGISMDSTPHTPYHHSLKIHEEAQHRKLPPLHHNLKDIDLNDAPVDTAATWEQGSEKSVADISCLSKKPVSLMKSEVPSGYVNCNSQIFPSPTLYSESKPSTGVPAFPVSVGAEKDSRCSPTLQYDLNIEPSIKCEPDMEMQPQRKEAAIDTRNLIDLNEPLPIMDDAEMDACESGELVPHEPDDPSRDSLAITAAENLVAISNVVIKPTSPQPNTLRWFADLATSKENTMFDKDSDDDFEALTLKLQETKSNEDHSTPRASQEDIRDNGHCSAASLLIPKPQRGKGRGRRQRKDFQKDILPCLASLPKHEVSEDLCALGRPKLVTPTKRGGRNGQQPRGRRRARSVAVSMEVEEAAEVSPPPVSPPLAPADLDTDALGITRWGRTTRRCRRPRCPPANNASLHVA
ncbi:hypothetical protein GQ55_3G448500 [Panicum hallii var. hallii]|uniref:Uncharacterized protein n=1 Tax=Panicum hallii var. hallii TaxID=1504633 RepID=A0A2T7EIG1_9POAL|nr:hypothetical protein GQ55_3G448500 [Panicum hallii var. hallii]